MTGAPAILARLGALPPAFDSARAERVLDAVSRFAGAARDTGRAMLGAFLGAPKGRALLAAVGGNSPYLARLILRDPAVLEALLADEPEAVLDALMAETEQHAATAADHDALMRVLRQAKTRAALLIALADIGAVWRVAEVTGALTRFADCCVNAGLRFCLRAEAAAGRLVLKDTAEPELGSGLIVLAMGKYGAGELNYSSDIDLVVFFDRADWTVAEGLDAGTVAVRVTRNLVKALSEQTADGYVFRTDLRLRPDAGATQIALSTEAAEIYYESMGQNWERAAMIKARACAGDRAAGERLLAMLQPFIWRKHLDFAAIEDIHSIKRQIHAQKGHGEIAIAGHDIKLGRGGIREIEFFVQTQQLIMGGREPVLRGRTTCGMLDALADLGLVAPHAANELKEAYNVLRMVEHRLQMIEDAQTHSLPRDRHDLDCVARFAGFAKTSEFEDALRGVLSTVQRHYSALFEHAPPLSESQGSLVFTGVDDDEETLETLEGLGFRRARDISALIRSWHHGRLRATRSARARELLTNLVPLLLRALSQTGDPDQAAMRFHRFLEGLPAGVQVFSLLYQNPKLLEFLVATLSTAPRLAQYLSHNSAVLDGLLDPDFLTEFPETDDQRRGLAAALAALTGPADYERLLDATRRWVHEQSFRIGVQILNGTADAPRAGAAFAGLAEVVLDGLLGPTVATFAERHGTIEGAGLVVLALGKLGGREMTATSDLDLIFVYDAPDDVVSKGARPLTGTEYFARLSQRIINALTAPTAEGDLYQVDMRLRPSGRSGPVATRIDGFARYQRENAWTWEHMALTRARPVAGDPALQLGVRDVVRAVLCQPRDQKKTAADVVDMRARVAEEYASEDPWELKYVRGGLVDLEFTAQYLGLVHGARAPAILDTNTLAMMAKLAEAGIVEASAYAGFTRAAGLIHALSQVLRVAVEEPFKPAEASPSLVQVLCRAVDAPSLGAVEAALIEAERTGHALFASLVEAEA